MMRGQAARMTLNQGCMSVQGMSVQGSTQYGHRLQHSRRSRWLTPAGRARRVRGGVHVSDDTCRTLHHQLAHAGLNCHRSLLRLVDCACKWLVCRSTFNVQTHAWVPARPPRHALCSSTRCYTNATTTTTIKQMQMMAMLCCKGSHSSWAGNSDNKHTHVVYNARLQLLKQLAPHHSNWSAVMQTLASAQLDKASSTRQPLLCPCIILSKASKVMSAAQPTGCAVLPAAKPQLQATPGCNSAAVATTT